MVEAGIAARKNVASRWNRESGYLDSRYWKSSNWPFSATLIVAANILIGRGRPGQIPKFLLPQK
jgi:hypothetical protein